MAAATRDSLGFLLPSMSSMEAASRAASRSRTEAHSPKWDSKRIPSTPLPPREKSKSRSAGEAAAGGDTPISIPSADSPEAAAHAAAYAQLMRDRDLKQLVRCGIPVEHRPTLWTWLSGGLDLAREHGPDAYRRLSRSKAHIEASSVMAIKDGVEGLWYSFRFNTLYQSSRVRQQ